MPREVIESEVQDLTAKYFQNFAGAFPPIEPSVTKILREVLAETTAAIMEPLVISVAKDGMYLTRNTLLVAKAKRDAPPPKPTPSPPAYTDPDYSGAVPMPSWVREQVEEYRKKGRG